MKAEGQQVRHDRRGAGNAAQGQFLQKKAEEEEDGEGDRQRQEGIPAEENKKPVRDKSPEHHEIPVAEIHHAHDAEGQGEAGGAGRVNPPQEDSVDQRLQKTLAGTTICYQTQALFEGVPAVETPADSELVRTVERLTGTRSDAVAFSTEAPFYNSMGMDSVVLGPGHINQAHQPNEYLATEQIKPAIGLIRNLVNHFCM